MRGAAGNEAGEIGTRFEEGPRNLATEFRFISWGSVVPKLATYQKHMGFTAPTSKNSVSVTLRWGLRIECYEVQPMTSGHSQV